MINPSRWTLRRTLSVCSRAFCVLAIVGTILLGWTSSVAVKAKSAAFAGGSITANPNPILDCDGRGVGVTILSWTSSGTTSVEVRVGSPSGTLFAQTGSSEQSGTTGPWVGQGTQFFLQNVSGGLPLTAANTLATVTVNLTTSGCGGPTPTPTPTPTPGQWTTSGTNISNTNTGNVGIGTAPSYKFDTLSSTNIIARFRSTAAANTQVLVDAPSGYNSNLTLQSAGASKWYLGNRASNHRFGLVSAINDSEMLTVMQNGNVGIGTIAPGFKLDLQGGQLNASGGLCIAGDCKTAWSQVAGGASSTISAANVSAHTFGANTGGGGYAFPSTLSVGGNLYFPGAAGSNFFSAGTGDGATYSTYNFALNGWWGMALKDYAGTVRGVYDFRSGNLTTDGLANFKGTGNHSFLGNVGIGTASPQGTLHTKGLFLFFDDTAGSISGGVFANQLASNPFTLWSGAGDFRIGTGVSDRVGTGFSERLRILNSNGNVGVGTAAPGFRLDVQGGQINASGGLCIAGICKTDWSQVGGGTGGTSPWNVASSSIYYNTGAVGIGTTTPGAQLHVNGAGETIYWGSGANIYPSAPNAGVGNLVGRAAASDYRIALQDGTGRVNHYWNSYYDAAAVAHKYIVSNEPAARFLTSINGTTGANFAFLGAPAGTAGTTFAWTQYGSITDTGIWWSPRGTSSDLFINSAGNLGVGTSTPGFKFDLQGGQLNASGGLCIAGVCKTDWSQVGGTGTSQWTTASPHIYYNSGNVGIGTASPGARLDIVGGNLRVQSGLLDFNNQIRDDLINLCCGGYTLGIRPWTFYAKSSQAFRFESALANSGMNAFEIGSMAGATFFSVKSDGSVGIGTASPASKLHIFNNSGNRTMALMLGQNIANVGEAGAAIEVNTAGSGTLYLGAYKPGTGYGTTAIQPEGGNVGVGTTAPGFKLDVQGGQLNASGGLCIAGICKTDWSQVGGGSGTPSPWSTNGGSIVYYNTGSVGIGTTNPGVGFKLDVQGGQINASGGLCIAGVCKSDWSQVGGGGGSPSPWSTLGSNVYFNTGNVGIGTTSPGFLLDVAGSVNNPFRVRDSSNREYFSTTTRAGTFGDPVPVVSLAGSRLIVDSSSPEGGNDTLIRRAVNNLIFAPSDHPDPALAGAMMVRQVGGGVIFHVQQTANGNVGIGTSAPTFKLDVQGGALNASGGLCIAGICKTDWSQVGGGTGGSSPWSTTGLTVYYNGGNVGIGTTSPTATLHVVGDGKVTGNLTVDGNISAKYQDVAEWVESSQELVPATVVVLDHTRSNQVVASSRAYDTRVAGVISAQPGIALGAQGENKVLVATTGRVLITVDASKGPIQIGDLLVTSDIPGVAMKSEAINIGSVQIHRPGTLIGKALEPLANGRGQILVLLSLQ